jgi:hypothetical protein
MAPNGESFDTAMSAKADVNMEEEPATLPFPALVPMEYDYSGGTHFYVRACYTEYYEYVFTNLLGGQTLPGQGVRNIRGVNVTGSPGLFVRGICSC